MHPHDALDLSVAKSGVFDCEMGDSGSVRVIKKTKD